MKYKVTEPTYDIKKSWDYNYDHGPFFKGPFPPLPKNRKWELLGHKLISPLGVAAGPIPNAKWIGTYAKLGYGSLIQKTVRSVEHHSHPVPNILILDVKSKLATSDKPIVGSQVLKKTFDKVTITNSFGNPSRAPDMWMLETKKALKTLSDGQILGVSVYGSKYEDMSLEDLANDYAKAAKLAKQAGAQFIEANLACPNVEGFEDPYLYKNKIAVASSVRAIKSKIGNKPLVIKVGYFDSYSQLVEILKAAKGYFEAVSAINTISKKIIDKNGNMALPRREVSGVCGYGIKDYGIDMTKKLNRARKELKMKYGIIGVGGIMNPEDVADYLNAGADHVQSATAVMWNPYLAYELSGYLQKNK